MDKPSLNKCGKDVKEYIEHIESKLEDFNSDSTIAKLYLGVKKQVDGMSNLMLTFDATRTDLEDKDNKQFDRVKFYLEKCLEIADKMDKMKKMISPEELNKTEKKLAKDGGGVTVEEMVS
jgi:GTP-binding protein EngB required for normal cell division